MDADWNFSSQLEGDTIAPKKIKCFFEFLLRRLFSPLATSPTN